MFLLAQAPRFSTGTPDVLNSENRVSLTLPLLNIGTGTATNVQVTSITLGSATRLSPPLPIFLGDLGVDNTVSVYGRFSSNGLNVGSNYLVTVRGTYQSDGTTFGFTVNRYVAIPSPVEPPIRMLKARAVVAVASGVWSYTLFNDESPGSQQFVNAFALDIVAPVTITGTPVGWEVITDNASFVLWFAADQALPYPHHIAPGASLGGFAIQSSRINSEATGFSITAWEHQNDEAGLVAMDAIHSPSRTG